MIKERPPLPKRLRSPLNNIHAGSRRRFLATGAAALGAAIGMTSRTLSAQSVLVTPERTLSFYNLHTGEALKAAYWAEGKYLPESLKAIDHLLRDYRNDEIKPIDVGLLNLLYTLTRQLGTSQPIALISGYRSPATNAMLHARSGEVAKHSLHTDGMAVDIRIAGLELGHLHHAAMALQGGGVGYYPQSGFVHLDVGRVRHWTGS
jgi:uncharacterized protein YcbK (DUF882 family)